MMGDPELDPEVLELERRLDAAFASMRPRAAFRDELEARLSGRSQGWWRRMLAGPARWPVLGGSVALLVVGTVATLLSGPLHGAAPTSSQTPPRAGTMSTSPASPISGPKAMTECADPTATAHPVASPSPTPHPGHSATPPVQPTCR
jgi:hypothetical protein